MTGTYTDKDREINIDIYVDAGILDKSYRHVNGFKQEVRHKCAGK